MLSLFFALFLQAGSTGNGAPTFIAPPGTNYIQRDASPGQHLWLSGGNGTWYHILDTTGSLISDNIRKCDNFPGINAGAKIVNCIIDLPSTGGTADARGLEGGIITQNVLSGVTKCFTLLLGAGTYLASVSQTFGSSCIRVIGLGAATVWQYTGGATTYIWGDNGPTTPPLYVRDELSNMTILGNANVADGLHIHSMHHSIFENLSIGNVTGACFWIGFAVANDYTNPHCTNNDMVGQVFSITPTNGMLFQGLDSSNIVTASHIIKPVIESVSGSGIKLRYSQALKFITGTSESNNINIETVAGGSNISDDFTALDLEMPTTNQILSESCSFCTWTSITQSNTDTKGARFTAGTGNTIIGGQWTNLTITGSISTTIINAYYATNGSGCGGFSDSGANTVIYRIVKYDCTLAAFTPFTNIGVIGSLDKGFITLQPGPDATHEGYIEFSLPGIRYGYLGNGAAGSVPLTLENGAIFNINGGLTAANGGLNVGGAPLNVSGFGIVAGSPTGGDKGSGTINTTGYWANGIQGFTGTKTIRNSAGTGTCNLDFTQGLLTASTC